MDNLDLLLRLVRAEDVEDDCGFGGCENIKAEHLSEAIQYRSLDRDFFV